MNRKRTLAIMLTSGWIFGMQTSIVEAQEPGQDGQYLIASGVPGSVPYNIGVGLSSLAQIVLLPEKDLSLSPVATEGYRQSLERLVDGTDQFAIADSVSAHHAAAGIGDELMAVATLWHEVDHFIIANEYVRSGTISDLAILPREDLATSLGNPEATRNLLTRFGVQIDVDTTPASFDGETLRGDFGSGVVAGLAITGPVPSQAVLETLQQRDGRAQLLEFSHWQMTQVGEGWHLHPLTADDYPGLATQVDTIARTMMLVVHRDVPEDAVYQLTKMMYDNLPYLANLEEAARQISLDHAQEVNLPFHPGAVRYFQEVGVLAEGSGGPVTTHLDAAMDHAGHGGDHQGHAEGPMLMEHVHDEAMLSRARAEAHDGEVVLKIGRPEVLRHPETEIFSVYFGLGKTDLAKEDATKIREITGRVMAIYETRGREPEVYVEGHTDSLGSWETNYEIAHRRARSVRDMFIAEGVPESWLHISDYSEQGQAVPTDDDVAEERNRRVEITVIPQN